MSLITAQAQIATRDLTVKFDQAYGSYTPFYPRLCKIRKSKRADEKYAWLGSMPGMREWLGDRVFHKLRAADYTLANKLWESSLEIQRQEFEDDELGFYDDALSHLGFEGAKRPDELFFELIVAGDSTACWDGQYFFDTDHVWGDSGTNNNDLAMDVVSNVAVTAAEAKAAYNLAVNAILGFKMDNGKPFFSPIIQSMNDLMILCPKELRQAFADGLLATTVSTGGQNVVLDPPEIITSPHLTAANVFYVFRKDQQFSPFVFQDRKPMMRQWKGYDVDDIEFKAVKFMTEARYNVGYLGYWNAVMVTLNNA